MWYPNQYQYKYSYRNQYLTKTPCLARYGQIITFAVPLTLLKVMATYVSDICRYIFPACSEAEVKNLKYKRKSHKSVSHILTLTLVRPFPISNLSEIFS